MTVKWVGAALLALVSATAGAQEVAALSSPRNSIMQLPELRVLGTIDPNVRKATAIVNGDIITDTDIEQRLNLVLIANQGKVDAEERERLRLQVMRNLIDEKLQIQEAATHDVKVSDAEVNNAYNRVAANFRQSMEAFEAFLRAGGSSPQSIRQQIRGEIAWSRLLRKRVEPFINVGDDEVQGVIKRLESAKGKQEYRVGEIFLSATPETQAAVLADAGRIVQQIRGGASFVAYARQFSESSTAPVGGDLGWVRAEQLSPELAAIVPNLARGAVSDPAIVKGGVTIVALIDQRQVLSADPLDAMLSLKQLSIPLKPDTSEAEARAMVTDIQAKTQSMGGCGRAEAVAKDIGASVTANDQLRIRDLPPPLQEILKTLPVGGATPPFGSQRDGLRVLVLCGRDDSQTASKLPSFDEVYGQMNEERVSMAARRYLRDLRRDAIIDYQ
ncbi:peptidylprolyl isomerase [Sandaracinobacteroides saxicola]|uniref:Parvulin-like PPIase n=1 Tax=Sandaracinobacteroides saxicola TaxID=2759707 RepID=A0A7G5IJN9_9SPHN|nr:peptidylprolyl isomerase [Sandaracinobacteroides saxicola]QMW23581.1 peptidylprolyl isomerase [Sandaracinobacteroides saxicola]